MLMAGQPNNSQLYHQIEHVFMSEALKLPQFLFVKSRVRKWKLSFLANRTKFRHFRHGGFHSQGQQARQQEASEKGQTGQVFPGEAPATLVRTQRRWESSSRVIRTLRGQRDPVQVPARPSSLRPPRDALPPAAPPRIERWRDSEQPPKPPDGLRGHGGRPEEQQHWKGRKRQSEEGMKPSQPVLAVVMSPTDSPGDSSEIPLNCNLNHTIHLKNKFKE